MINSALCYFTAQKPGFLIFMYYLCPYEKIIFNFIRDGLFFLGTLTRQQIPTP